MLKSIRSLFCSCNILVRYRGQKRGSFLQNDSETQDKRCSASLTMTSESSHHRPTFKLPDRRKSIGNYIVGSVGAWRYVLKYKSLLFILFKMEISRMSIPSVSVAEKCNVCPVSQRNAATYSLRKLMKSDLPSNYTAQSPGSP